MDGTALGLGLLIGLIIGAIGCAAAFLLQQRQRAKTARGVAEEILIDARHARWSSPYGLTALLTLAQTRTERPALAVPEHDDTASYWARAAFFHHAESLYDLHGSYPKRRETTDSNALLDITPITKSEDVHNVVGRVQERAQAIIQACHPRISVGRGLTDRFDEHGPAPFSLRARRSAGAQAQSWTTSPERCCCEHSLPSAPPRPWPARQHAGLAIAP